MKVEFQTLTIPIDERVQDKVQAFVSDGWQIIPGAAPVAVYHLQRFIPDPATAGIGGITIDDSLLTIEKAKRN